MEFFFGREIASWIFKWKTEQLEDEFLMTCFNLHVDFSHFSHYGYCKFCEGILIHEHALFSSVHERCRASQVIRAVGLSQPSARLAFEALKAYSVLIIRRSGLFGFMMLWKIFFHDFLSLRYLDCYSCRPLLLQEGLKKYRKLLHGRIFQKLRPKIPLH